MKLLICTQAVDKEDPVLGFFHRWIQEFALHAEQVTVICLREGVHNLPTNVTVHSLGKEQGSRPGVVYALRFLRYAYALRHRYEVVFVHMNSEYLVVAGFMWRMLSKRTALWYMHKTVSLRLRIAVFWADLVFTASPRSMRVKTRKKRVVGHGIPIDSFVPVQPPPADRPISLLTIGRLSQVKRIEILIDTLAILVGRGMDARLTIAGAPAGNDGGRYARSLVQRARERGIQDNVQFIGPVSNDRIYGLFKDAHLFLHASNTGSLDKASLEPLAVGVPVSTVDSELAQACKKAVILAQPEPNSFAATIEKAAREEVWREDEVREEARSYIAEHHSLKTLVEHILTQMAETMPAPATHHKSLLH